MTDHASGPPCWTCGGPIPADRWRLGPMERVFCSGDCQAGFGPPDSRHQHVYDADADCRNCGADLLAQPGGTPAGRTEMDRSQRVAWERDVPSGCPCDYIWTGMAWTRSGSTPCCEMHGLLDGAR